MSELLLPRPMLVLQGTRDRLAELERIQGVCDGLGGVATLHVVEGADHGFEVLRRSGRTADEVQAEIAALTAEWIDLVLRPSVAPAGGRRVV